MGGAAGSYSFEDDSDAQNFAGAIWNNFLGGSSSTRPFSDAVLDGLVFNFDVERKIRLNFVDFTGSIWTLKEEPRQAMALLSRNLEVLRLALRRRNFILRVKSLFYIILVNYVN